MSIARAWACRYSKWPPRGVNEHAVGDAEVVLKIETATSDRRLTSESFRRCVFRSLWIGMGPRRSPSAYTEMSKKNTARRYVGMEAGLDACLKLFQTVCIPRRLAILHRRPCCTGGHVAQAAMLHISTSGHVAQVAVLHSSMSGHSVHLGGHITQVAILYR